ncbi:MAG: double zinc ribbon domain-containing protein, partial [Nevskiales bacterium]
MRCIACGHDNPASAKFCQECGERLTPAADAERRQLTVLFCDLVGSTQLSQQLDAEHFRELVLGYQKAAGEVIERYEGH